jgi:hypothetical protein
MTAVAPSAKALFLRAGMLRQASHHPTGFAGRDGLRSRCAVRDRNLLQDSAGRVTKRLPTSFTMRSRTQRLIGR